MGKYLNINRGYPLIFPIFSYTNYLLFSITCVLLPFSCTRRLRKFSRHCKMEIKNFFCYLKALPDVVWTWGSSIEKLLSQFMPARGLKNWTWKIFYFTFWWMRMTTTFQKQSYSFSCDFPLPKTFSLLVWSHFFVSPCHRGINRHVKNHLLKFFWTKIKFT